MGINTHLGHVREQNECQRHASHWLFVVAVGVGRYQSGEGTSTIAVNTIRLLLHISANRR